MVFMDAFYGAINKNNRREYYFIIPENYILCFNNG